MRGESKVKIWVRRAGIIRRVSSPFGIEGVVYETDKKET